MKNSVKIIVEKISEGFSVYVPDLPGCITLVDSIDGVEGSIRESIDFHIEGMKEDGDDIPFNFHGKYDIELKLMN